MTTPELERAGAWVEDHPVLTTLLLAVASYLCTGHSLAPTDGHIFTNAGLLLIHGHWHQVYASSLVQAGPLALLAFGLIAPLPLSAVLCLVTAAVAVLFARRLGGGLVTVVVIAGGLLDGALRMDDAHPTHVLIALLWLLALQGRGPGVALGAAMGLDSWGVLGIGLLRSWRQGLVAAVTAGLIWLPFVLAGPFRSGDATWHAVPRSLPALLGAGSEGWGWRLAQGAVVIMVGAVLARRAGQPPWLVPAALIATRIALDPLDFGYYGKPLRLLLLAGAAGAYQAERRVLVGGCLASLLLVEWVRLGPLPTAGPVAAALVATAFIPRFAGSIPAR